MFQVKVVEKIKIYILELPPPPRDQNAGRIHSVRIDNSTFDRVEEFKYLGTILTN